MKKQEAKIRIRQLLKIKALAVMTYRRLDSDIMVSKIFGVEPDASQIKAAQYWKTASEKLQSNLFRLARY